ncbi:putative beta-lysine N-acetyltransferase [Bacillus salitolerans]|uniref:Beta-lysine N-acetyltransferase n=1 Tax=Bacillus salitolerans TaxID=1437434 RepID=A0ABW4LTD2_9BACI
MPSEAFYEQKVAEGDKYYMSVCLDHFNQRLRVDDYRGNIHKISMVIMSLSAEYAYSKAIVYARREHVHDFVEAGFLLEAIIEGYFNGSHAYALTKYFEQGRKKSDKWIKEDNTLHQVLKLKKLTTLNPFPEDYVMRKATLSDVDQLASLYGEVFQIYPTPLNNPSYIEKIMNDSSIFFLIEKEGKIVSAASATVNSQYCNAEITDCATLPEHREHGLMKHIMLELEQELIKQKVFSAYSIARALSYGMNAALYQLHYKYKGRMTNNCYIYDKMEDMNVWVKDLSVDG